MLAVLLLTASLGAQSRLLTAEDFARIDDTASRYRWAADVKSSIVTAAEAWPQAHLSRYGLRELTLPPEGGQWWHWYVCPTTGVRLRFEAPNGHVCPSDNRRLTGWPYDQVIYSERHDALANAARDLALAFRLTGNRKYEEQAAWILNAYAERYNGFALHDKDNRNTRTGARVHAQTLDEAIWLIPMAWAYDLLAGSDVLTGEQRAKIERDLLRAATATVERYDAGISNWQTWHNAGMAAVAFTLNDTALIQKVVEGVRFQLKNSTTADGFWYEGSFTYHYYALDALMQTAEMAARSGVDLFADERFAKLFSAPAMFALPDGTLAPFNDATTVNLRIYNRWYESAYARWQDPLFASIAGLRSRTRDALLWGVPELPPPSAAQPERASTIFPDSGYAVLRSATDHTVILKYGPHGGGHGHYDKLNFVSYARDGVLAIDPGTQAYGAPTHATWDQQTVAHNTMVVDERTQAAATGELLAHRFEPGFSFARANAGTAYQNAALTRSMLVTGEYALDVFDAASKDGLDHQFDWVYHNYGEVLTDLPLAAGATLPRTAGYQHLTGNRSATTANPWQLRFDGSRLPSPTYGAVFASTANVKGSFTLSREQIHRGTASGKLSYQFNGAGYLLYTTASAPAVQPDVAPKGIRVMLYGDGSRHRVALRFNDASDERFVTPLITIDWTGWKEIEVTGPQRWTHYLGNNDGIVDLPVRNVSFELQQTSGAPADGALYVDDVDLVYELDEAIRVAEFEAPIRGVRVWMLGEPGTTVVTGNGLGEDLTRPVPYVMARRRTATQTQFVTLLEPYGSEPTVLRFERSENGTLVVSGPSWKDTIRFTAEGVEYRRE